MDSRKSSRKSSKKSSKKPSSKIPVKSVKTVAEVASIAKKVVEKNEITKTVMNLTVMNKVNIPGAGLNGSTEGQFAAIIPLITQGSGEDNRQGNVIHVKSFKIRYSIRALLTNVGGNNAYNGVPFLVRVVVYRHKYNIGDNSPANLIDVNNTSSALTGDLDTYFRPYNKDEYMIGYSKTHRMSAAAHFDGTNITPSNQDPKSSSFVFKTTEISLPKKLYFNDTLTTPTNAGWYIGFSVCNTDEADIPATSFRATANVESILEFYD